MECSTEYLTVFGNTSLGGTYILRLGVNEPLHIAFGRFLQGTPIYVPPGDYLYIGSALSQKGSSSLARRLLRHATRSGKKPCHLILPYLQSQFVQVGLADALLNPPRQKKKYWHVDYLLDEASVELKHIHVIRSSQRLESIVSKNLMQDSATTVIKAGLGARDAVGETHLLGVTAVADWWQQLPQKIIPLLA
jgi:Uri superfamily endonuclease